MPPHAEIIQLFKGNQRRFYGLCQRCDRVDYLPWATEHGIRYCGHCWEADALSYSDRPKRATSPCIEALEAALQFIADGYDNQDINHVDYRVKVYQVATEALVLSSTENQTP